MDTAVTHQGVYNFGPFRLDPAERLLLRDGDAVALTPKAFDLLVYLAARPGHLVEKNALMVALWPDAIVEEANLASTVSALRKALDDDGQRFIATVPTRGYRFVAPVSVDPATPQVPASLTSASAVRKARWGLIAIFGVGSVLIFVAGWFIAGAVKRTPPATLSVRLSIEPAEGIRGPEVLFERWAGRNRPSRTSIVLSPDGRHLVFAGVRGDKYQLWVRPLDSDIATPLAGTEEGAAPFFSPDGQWVGFWARQALWKVPFSGGAPVKICDSPVPFGASWGTDDRIVFADRFAGGLMRVPAAGGAAPEVLTEPNVSNEEGSHRLPFVLPGAKAVLFTILVTPGSPGAGNTHVAIRSLETGEQRLLIRGAADARYAPSGHLVYVANETLTAVPFDLRTLRVTGAPVGIVDRVMQANYGGNTGLITMAAQFALSQSGSLAWIPAAVDPNPELFRKLVWVDRHGNSSPIDAIPDAYYCPRISPNGERIAVQTAESTPGAMWIYDTRRKTRTRIPFDGVAKYPQWTPNGKRIAFAGARTGMLNLFWVPADASGPAERLATLDGAQMPTAWTPDGQTVVFVQCERSSNNCDIWALSPGVKGAKPQVLVHTPADDLSPALSPDGRWLAYVSGESGRWEVYVQAFPTATGKYQISNGSGAEVAWSRDGHTLYYYAPAQLYPAATQRGNIYFAVDVSTNAGFSASAARRVFDDPEQKYVVTIPVPSLDVGPDGRFLMVEVKRGPGVVPPPPNDVRLLVNWTSRLH